MAEKKSKEESFECPVGTFLKELNGVFGRRSPFFEHMTQSKVEFLKGIRSLLDERIENLEKKNTTKSRKKMTNIKVE